MSYRLLIILTAIIGTGMVFALNVTQSSLSSYDSLNPIQAGTVIGEEWYNEASKALNCPDETVFV